MKQLLKALSISILLLYFSSAFAQTIVTPSGSLILKSRGSIAKGVDRATFRRYKYARTSNYYLSSYFVSTTNKQSLTGLCFRNDAVKADGTVANVLLGLQNDSLKVFLRKNDKEAISVVASTPNITFPVWLKAEKTNNDFTYYYSKQPSTTGTVSWTKLGTIQNVFTSWTTASQNILSPAGTALTTVEVAKVNYGNATVATLPACDCGFALEQVAQVGTSSNVTFTFNSCSVNTLNWQITNGVSVVKSGIISPITTATPTVDVGTLTAGIYTFTATAANCTGTGSKTFAYNVTTATNASESNVAKSITKLTTFDAVIPLAPFASTPTQTYTDANGYIRPKWAIWWQAGGKPFSTANIKPYEVGLAGGTDYIAGFSDGWGTRGQHYVFLNNPDTNVPYSGGIDPSTVSFYPPSGISYTNFISTIPYQFRTDGQGILNDANTPSSLQGCYDAGVSFGLSPQMGLGDNLSGKTKRGLVVFDFESNTQTNEKQVAALIGAASTTAGYVAEHYSTPLDAIGYNDPSHNRKYYNYPNTDGTYPSNAEINTKWNYLNPLRISVGSISNKSLLDYANIQPMLEISSYYSYFMPEGSTLNLGGSNNLTVRKFGSTFTTDWNVIHGLAHYGYLTETMAYYCREKLNRKPLISAKLISDRNLLGVDDYLIADNGTQVTHDPTYNRSNFLHNRKYGFMLALLCYMNGADYFVWDKVTDNSGSLYNPDRTKDGYIGSLAAIKMVNQSGGVAAFNDMTPQYWNSEYSLDGTTWIKTKACDWSLSKTSVLPVRVKVGSNKLEIAAFRPEGVEPVEFWVRATVAGTLRTVHITANMWETTNPTYLNTALSALPNTAKEYYYKLLTY